MTEWLAASPDGWVDWVYILVGLVLTLAFVEVAVALSRRALLCFGVRPAWLTSVLALLLGLFLYLWLLPQILSPASARVVAVVLTALNAVELWRAHRREAKPPQGE